jgi:ACS family hexuronate transporter-like MFS transporter
MTTNEKMTNFRWIMCAMLFIATTVNYLDRQVLSLTWDEFIKPEFHWNDDNYGTITAWFSIFYAVCMLFAGKFVDWMGTKKGYLWAIGVWSAGACLHAVCGILTESWVGLHSAAELTQATGDAAVVVATVSMYCFLVARSVLALGEAGNFPAAIKVTAEYNPKKDRAFSTSIFNAGASVGALTSPLTIPPLAKAFGWEMAFVIIGALGFVWMGFWVFLYNAPEKNKFVNKAELDYIEQDKAKESEKPALQADGSEKKISFLKSFTYKQTWAFVVGKFMTDGVWWFFLFWTPSYLKANFGIKTTEGLGMALIFTLYLITTVLSIYGGKLPTIFINRSGQNPYAARMKAMLIFAFFPLCVLLAQPLGEWFMPSLGQNAAWLSVLMISMGCAAHQAWSANIFSTVGDMFPKSAIATITGIGGMAGGLGSMFMQKSAGSLFTYAAGSTMKDGNLVEMSQELLAQGFTYVREPLTFLGFEGKPAGYFIIFIICAFAYLIGWSIMNILVPKYKLIVVE